ncbi:DUF3566 domain-containing protein [Mycolicibacterium sp. XJ870]
MSSPNESGFPRAGDRPGSNNGSAAGGDGGAVGSTASRATGHITDSGEVPPWQRGPARTAQQPPAESRGEGSRPSPGADARPQRFTSGAEAAEPDQPPRPAPRSEPRNETRTETVRPEAYASELPDLSGPVPRPPQRKPTDTAAARASSTPTTRIQVANRPQSAAAGPVRASMQIRRVDPWTVLKVSLVLSVCLFFVWMIAVAFLYVVLGGMGVWSKLNSNVGDLLTSASGSTGGELVSSGTIFGGAALVGLVNIVVLSALATVGAFIYNLTTDLVGGVEVTLADRD